MVAVSLVRNVVLPHFSGQFKKIRLSALLNHPD